MKMKKISLLLTASLLFFSFACSSSSQPKLPEGRCNYNSDCPQGYACRDTFCKDIYYPDEKIKMY
jgi:hypothetical protein